MLHSSTDLAARESRQGVPFETHFSCERSRIIPGPGGMPERSANGSAGRRGWDAGDAGEEGGRVAGAGGSEQRVHGDSEVTALGDNFAAGERNADIDSCTQRGACEVGPGSDDDRSAAAAGDGGLADRDGAAEEGDVRLRQCGTGAAEEAVCGWGDEQGSPGPGAAGLR